KEWQHAGQVTPSIRSDPHRDNKHPSERSSSGLRSSSDVDEQRARCPCVLREQLSPHERGHRRRAWIPGLFPHAVAPVASEQKDALLAGRPVGAGQPEYARVKERLKLGPRRLGEGNELRHVGLGNVEPAVHEDPALCQRVRVETRERRKPVPHGRRDAREPGDLLGDAFASRRVWRPADQHGGLAQVPTELRGKEAEQCAARDLPVGQERP
ncbi:hypothetical protein DFJ74DRAFT_101097, partial [Hyaloraphidium curvatum]